jgi:hypothetical protein
MDDKNGFFVSDPMQVSVINNIGKWSDSIGIIQRQISKKIYIHCRTLFTIKMLKKIFAESCIGFPFFT